MSYLWVIEIFENGRWQATVGAGLTREDARREKKTYWEFNMPDDKFRIRKYSREF